MDGKSVKAVQADIFFWKRHCAADISGLPPNIQDMKDPR